MWQRYQAAVALGLFLAPLAAHAAGPSVLHFVPQYEAPVFDPVASVLAVVQQRAYLTYDTLFSLDADGVAQPQMVGSYARDASGRTYSFTLRPGLVFHDGAPVRAADAVASIKRWAQRDTDGAMLLSLGMKLAVIDDHSFTVTTDEPTPVVLEGFSKPAAEALFIMREADALTPPTQPVADVVGSGPFRFVRSEFVPGAKAVYERNPAYVPRDEPPSYYAGGHHVYVDRVEVDIMPDPSVAVAALGKGEADVLDSVSLDMLPILQREAGVETRLLKTGGMVIALRPNQLHPPFDNEKAREALLAMVDQQDVMDIASGSNPQDERECHGFMGCGSAQATQAGMEAYRRPNYELGRRLLRESGYDGRRVVLLQPGDLSFMRDITELIAQEMKAIGFDVELRTTDYATMAQRRASQAPPDQGGWNLFPTFTYDFELASPIDNFFLDSPCNKRGWFGWPCDPPMQELRRRWALESDPAKRGEIYVQIQQRAAVSAPYVPMGQYFTAIANRTSVTGFLDVPLTVFWNVRKAD